MKTFFILFGITFIMVLLSAGLINIAKTRQRKNKHHLRGMCHKSGGTTCSSCASPPDKDADSKKCTPSAAD